MLEGFTLGALICGVLGNLISKRLETPADVLIETLTASTLPRNHHIQRVVRRAALLATRNQVLRYLDRVKAATGSDLPDDSQHFHRPIKRLDRMIFKSRFWAIGPAHEMTDATPVSSALTAIGGGSLSEAEAALSRGLADTALQELLDLLEGWGALPAELMLPWHDPDTGWSADFRAWVADAIAKDDGFQKVWSSLTQNKTLATLNLVDAFQRQAARDVSERIDRIDTLLRDQSIRPRDVDRFLTAVAASEDRFSRLLESLPVGRRHDGALAAADVDDLIARLVDGFAGRDADLDRIWDFVEARQAGENGGVLIVTAPAGFGKSSLAAAWCTMAGSDPDIHVVRHFANQLSSRRRTTDPGEVHDHLAAQLAAIVGETIDGSRSENILSVLLERGATDGQPVVLWLDGLDEVSGGLPPFLPARLAPGTVVIVSARAHNNEIPAYLQPWIEIAAATQDTGRGGAAPRLHLEKLPLSDIEELVTAAFARADLATPAGLPGRIYAASEDGYALFARAMVEDAVQAVRGGATVDLGPAPESLAGYVSRIRDGLAAHEAWPRIGPGFITLSVLREAVTASELGDFSGVDATGCRAWPAAFRRWLTIAEPTENGGDPMIGFAHPKLSEMFARAFGKSATPRSDRAVADVLNRTPWSDYGLRHLPAHLIAAEALGRAAAVLSDDAFIDARIDQLGADVGPRLMASDWNALRRVDRAPSDLVRRHQRFWGTYAGLLWSETYGEPVGSWKQLAWDVGLIGNRPPIRLAQARLDLLPRELATLHGHTRAITGVVPLADGRLLSWGKDNALRLWEADGTSGPVLEGHSQPVAGALVLADGRFLSWSYDKTLRFWGADGTRGPVLRGHSDTITGATTVADGRVVSWSWDKTLMYWEPDGTPGPVLQGHSGAVRGALALADGRILSWSSDKSLRLWEADGTPGPFLRGHTGVVVGAIPLANGLLVSWSRDSTLRLWEAGGAAGPVLRGHSGAVVGATPLADGRILSWSGDCTLRLWEADGSPGPILDGHSGAIRGAIAFSDGRVLSWSQDNTLRFWGAEGSPGPLLCGHTRPASGAIALPDSRILSWSDDTTLRLWEADGTTGPVLRAHVRPIKGAVPLTDGRILSWSEDTTLRLWEADGAAEAVVSARSRPVRGAIALANGRIISWSGDDALRLWEADGSPGPVLRGHSGAVVGAIPLVNGRVLSWSRDSTLRLWEANGTPRLVLRGHTRPVRGAIALTDGRILSWSNDKTLRLWEADGTPGPVLRGQERQCRGTVALADGRILSWSSDKTLRIWEADGTPGPVLRGHSQSVNDVATLAAGHILSWSGDKILRLWEADGTPGPVLRGHVRAVRGAIPLADGRVLSWSGDRTLRLWEADGIAGPVLRGHTRAVRGAIPLADGRNLSWSADRTLRLWEADGIAGPVLRGHTRAVRGAVPLADGRILSWSEDNTVRLWETDGTPGPVWICPAGGLSGCVLCGACRAAAIAGPHVLLVEWSTGPVEQT